MIFRPIGATELNRIDYHSIDNHVSQGSDDAAPVVNLQQEIMNAADEMADILSAFGRFSKATRKKSNDDNGLMSSMLEDNADSKIDSLIKQVAKLRDKGSFLNFARSLFPNDSDLMLALRELLLSRFLTDLQKKKVKEAISDLEKFSDRQKMQSGINAGRIAKRFAECSDGKQLSAKELRNSYLRFLEVDLPPGFIYQDWIEEYGSSNRKRLLSFMMSALVADIKSNEPGIHFEEFGPLIAKLSEARILHTLDQSLIECFDELPFRQQMRNEQLLLSEEDIIRLYMKGINEFDEFKISLHTFNDSYMSLLLIKQRATVIQALRNIYNSTPAFLYADTAYREIVLDFISTILLSLYEKEKNIGIWSEYYKK